jgi:rod shape-determining protein MreC
MPRSGATPRFAVIRTLAHRFAYMGLVVASFALMMLGKADAVLMERLRLQVTDAVAPIVDALSRPTAAVAELVVRGRELADLREENARLREENARLLQWQAAARRLEAENDGLRGLLNFIPEPQVSFIAARVIGDTGGAFVHSVLVNAGTREGVAKGQAVVSGEGLVGRVAAAGFRSARILLLTDLNSRVPVAVGNGRIRAILAGDNSSRPRLIHLPPGAEVSPGDRVFTSAHAGAFPPGLPVGVVSAVGEAGIKAHLFVDRDRLEFVRVVDYGLTGILNLPESPPPPKRGRQR